MNNGHLESFHGHESHLTVSDGIPQHMAFHTASDFNLSPFDIPEYLCYMRLMAFLMLMLGTHVAAIQATAQTDSSQTHQSPATEGTWWKGLFRDVPANVKATDRTDQRARAHSDSTGHFPAALDTIPPFHLGPAAPSPASFSWEMPDTLAVLDSLDKTDPKPLKGYRIQIYFGDLQGARSVRASFRRDHPDVPCQLMPISPNYAVTVGDYRDLWSAKRALRDNEVGRWANALVVPSDINFPALR